MFTILGINSILHSYFNISQKLWAFLEMRAHFVYLCAVQLERPNTNASSNTVVGMMYGLRLTPVNSFVE